MKPAFYQFAPTSGVVGRLFPVRSPLTPGNPPVAALNNPPDALSAHESPLLGLPHEAERGAFLSCQGWHDVRMTDTGVDRVYTLQGAAAATGRSMPTIRRRREQLVAAGAVVDPRGWRIPQSALVAAGFDPSWTTEQPQEPRSEPVEVEPIPTPTEELRVTQDRVRRLESENTVLRSQVEHWQLIARERLDALNDQRVAFRALVMARPPELEATPEPAESQQADEPRRGWWSRRWT